MTREKAGQLLSENMNVIYMWSLSKAEDSYKAEDLCSEIMLAVLNSAENLRSDDAFFGFLWQVASNVYKLSLRKNKKQGYAELDENVKDESDFTEELFELEEVNSLRRELSILSNEYRKCTVSYYYDNLSCKEISEKYVISCDMVKYYLFKSRKILKEGIAMERQFGEKSFKPAEFQLTTVYSGKYDKTYDRLFQRKLPGQILLSAFYQPMTVEQLSVELGVASVYLEDELTILEEYGFIMSVNKKYVTNIVIITEQFTNALIKKLNEEFSEELSGIIKDLKSKLPKIKDIGFAGCDIDDMLLLWDLYALFIMRATQKNVGRSSNWDTLYSNVKGVNFGYNFCHRDFARYSYICCAALWIPDDDIDNLKYSKYKCTFLGWMGIDCFTEFGNQEKEKYILDNFGVKYPVFTKDEISKLDVLLEDVEKRMNDLVKKVNSVAHELILEHSPKHLKEKIDAIYPSICGWTNYGWYGGAALDTGVLTDPKNKDDFAGIVGYKD